MGDSPAGGPGLKVWASNPSSLQKLRPCKAQALGDAAAVEKGLEPFWEGWAEFPASDPWGAAPLPGLAVRGALTCEGEQRKKSLSRTTGESCCVQGVLPQPASLSVPLCSARLGPHCALYLERSSAGGWATGDPVGQKLLPSRFRGRGVGVGAPPGEDCQLRGRPAPSPRAPCAPLGARALGVSPAAPRHA